MYPFQTLGDFYAHISYVPVPDPDYEGEKEPALIIAAKNNMHGRNYAAVCLSALWKYADEAYLAKRSIQIAEKLGVGAIGGYQVSKLINNWIDDLCMAEEFEMVEDERHPKKKPVAGEVKLYVDGELTGEQEVH